MSHADDPYVHLDQRQLLLQALAAFAFGLTGLLFAMAPASFVLAYMLQLWVVMCVAGSLMFWSDEKQKADNHGPGKSITTAVILFSIGWALLVALPLGTTWLELVAPEMVAPTAQSLWSLLAQSAPALLLSLPFFVWMAWRLLRRYEQEKRAGKIPDLKTPVWHRTICLYSFVLFGPFLYRIADGFLAPTWPAMTEERRLSLAIVFAYACCEAYPYLAALFERWGASRRPSRVTSSSAGKGR